MGIIRSLKALGWQMLYSQWHPLSIDREGYTILLMFPGDLPVFLDIAMAVCARQDLANLAEVLVIPDTMHRRYEQQWERICTRWPYSPIRLVRLRRFEQQFANLRKDPATYNWLQLIRGMEQARSTHALWHDCDLFLLNQRLLREQYEECIARGAAFFGVDPAWPLARRQWFESHGVHHIVATYEMIMETSWFRRFAPWEHRGQEMKVSGERRVGDITYRSQMHTPPERCRWKNRDDDFVHFSYVIGMYRWFQKSKGACEDKGFKLLLVRLLIDALDRSGWPYEVPTVADLAKGLRDPRRRVTYAQPETCRAYHGFRGRLERLLTASLLGESEIASIREGIAPFDEAFGQTTDAAVDRA